MAKDTVLTKVKKLDKIVRDSSKDYFHSRPVVQYFADGEDVSFDLRNLLVISAFTGNNVLVTGSTGCGKTHLAKMTMAGLFGDKGYKPLQMDASFSLDKLRDFDFKTIKEGGRLNQAVEEAPIINVPGVIIDEYNRAPAEITNIIQGWLQNGTLVFEGGREVYPGVVFNGRERYQWKIATVNEGSRYSGARKLDKASRDRLAVEIPMDIFPPTDEDKIKMRSKTTTSIDAYDGNGALEDVLTVLTSIRDVQLSDPAQEFLLYLQRMNQCTKAPNKTKLEVENFSPEYCKGCRLNKDLNNICGSVMAPSDRSVIALQNLARGFALLRYAKKDGNPEKVTADIEDVIAAAPFVLLSKIDIHPGWMDSVGKGSRWQAVNAVVKRAYERFQKFLKDNYERLSEPKEESLIAIKKYGEEQDAWAVDLK